jgi:hypothetical protein
MDVKEYIMDIKHNPWAVESLKEFLFYCCPACPDRCVTKKTFINHALIKHPQVKLYFIDIKKYS